MFNGYIIFAENGSKVLNSFWGAAYALRAYGLCARLGACHDTRLRLACARYLRYAGRDHGMISLYAAITADDAYFEMTLITLKQ